MPALQAFLSAMNSPSASAHEVFALLDDARSGVAGEALRSRLYTDYQTTIDYYEGQSLAAFFDSIENLLATGLHAVGLFSYEFGYQLNQLPGRAQANKPLATLLFFSQCDRLSAADVGHWLDARAADAAFAVQRFRHGVTEQEFIDAVSKTQRYIEAGDTYQVNLTFPVDFELHGDPCALYAALRVRQPVPYGALIALPDGSQVLSLSPELFVSHHSGHLTCKPMKGTAAASSDATADAQRRDALAGSAKERAENLMIVDLLRSDLGRIAVTGSVKVRELFAVERFGSVLQMTSTVEAVPREGLTLQACIAALFPCGSVTGAPKRRAMQIVQELERRPRDLYTGAIGWFDPPSAKAQTGEFTLSVPIRTLLLDPPSTNDCRSGVMGVGAGIVYDSDARAEYQECLLKAEFLTGLASQFDLFETLHATQEGVRHSERHLARLSASAAHFGFRINQAKIRNELSAACRRLAPGAHRMRACLSADGRLRIEHSPLLPLESPVKLLIATQTMSSHDSFLAHKTTLRRTYDQAWQAAEAAGAFDTLFLNERGEITEGGRCNVFVRFGAQWFTPPLSAGVLPGVMRAVLLDDQSLQASERVLTLKELREADELWVCNALRGVLQAEIDWVQVAGCGF